MQDIPRSLALGCEQNPSSFVHARERFILFQYRTLSSFNPFSFEMSSDSEDDEPIVKSEELRDYYNTHTRPMLEMERKK